MTMDLRIVPRNTKHRPQGFVLQLISIALAVSCLPLHTLPTGTLWAVSSCPASSSHRRRRPATWRAAA